MKKIYYIYLHKTKEGVVFYVGKGTDEGNMIFERSKFTQRSKYWKNVSKNGYDIEVVYQYDDEKDCFNKETELIKFYGRRDLGLGTLVNLTDGGEGMENPSMETRKKLSEARTGNKNHKFGKKTPIDVREKISKTLTGRKLPKEVCEKMSIAKSGEKHHMFGKVHKEESKYKMSIAKQGVYVAEKNHFFGKTHNDDVKKVISEKAKGRRWINNGITDSTAKGDELTNLLQNGWVYGRLRH